MRRTLLTALAAGLAIAGCGGGEQKKQSTRCLSGNTGAGAAARDHVDVIVVGARTIDAKADRVKIKGCRTSDEDATATVTVFGVRDRRVADQRHQMTLVRKAGRWTIVRDLDTQRCRRGHGHRDFSSLICR